MTFLITSGASVKLKPNVLGWEVNVSFVWLSKAGFSIWAVKNTHSDCLTCLRDTSRFLCFFLISSIILSIKMLATSSTWVPPFTVQIELTNETWVKSCRPIPPGATEMHASHFALWSKQRNVVAECAVERYISQYCLKLSTFTFVPFRYTFTDGAVIPARSITLLLSRFTVSLSKPYFIPNLVKSG